MMLWGKIFSAVAACRHVYALTAVHGDGKSRVRKKHDLLFSERVLSDKESIAGGENVQAQYHRNDNNTGEILPVHHVQSQAPVTSERRGSRRGSKVVQVRPSETSTTVVEDGDAKNFVSKRTVLALSVFGFLAVVIGLVAGTGVLKSDNDRHSNTGTDIGVEDSHTGVLGSTGTETAAPTIEPSLLLTTKSPTSKTTLSPTSTISSNIGNTISSAVPTTHPTDQTDSVQPVPTANPTESEIETSSSPIPTQDPSEVPTVALQANTQSPTASQTDATPEGLTTSPTISQTNAMSEDHSSGSPTAYHIAVTMEDPTESPTTSNDDNTQQESTRSPTTPVVEPTQESSTESPTSSGTDTVQENSLTGSPTMSHVEPSAEPRTNAPTQKPTQGFTNTPSEIPTEIPTIAPSSAPTNVPSLTPTGAPTKAPTGLPSAAPTQVPTSVPTSEPSIVPSATPTQEGVLIGNVHVSDTSELFEDLESVVGDVTLTSVSGSLTSIFPNLMHIYGSLNISGTQATAIQFPQLTTVTDIMSIENNPILASVSFDKLETIGTETTSRSLLGEDSFTNTSTGLSIINNDNLQSIASTFPNLAEVRGSINIHNNALSSVVFPALSSIGQGHISISSNSLLENIDFPKLHHVLGSSSSSLTMNDNWVLEVVSAPELVAVDGEFSIQGANNLTTVNTGSLTTVGGDFLLDSRRGILDELALSHGYMIGGSTSITRVHRYIGDVTIKNASPDQTFTREIIIGDVDVAEDFSSDLDASTVLPGLQEITGDLRIEGTTARSVSFPELEVVRGGSIIATDNGILAEVNFQNLAEIVVSEKTQNRALSAGSTGDLDVSSNAVLSSANFGSLVSVHGYVRIAGNGQSSTATSASSEIPDRADVLVKENDALQAVDVSNFQGGGGGNVRVESNAILNAVNLTSVSGANAITINDNAALKVVDMLSLNQTLGNITIVNNRALASVRFENVTAVGGLVRVTGNGDTSIPDSDSESNVLIQGNAALQHLDLSKLDPGPRAVINIEDNVALESVSLDTVLNGRFDGKMLVKNTGLKVYDLPGLANIDGDVVFVENSQLEVVNMPDVVSIEGSFFIGIESFTYNDTHVEDAPPSCYSASGCSPENLLGNWKLQNLEVPSLEAIAGGFYVLYTSLEEIYFPELKSVDGEMYFCANPKLRAIGMPQLESVDGNLDLSCSFYKIPFSSDWSSVLRYRTNVNLGANVNLTTLNVNNMKSINGWLSPAYTGLTEFILPALESLDGDLRISHNPALEVINIPRLPNIAGGVMVFKNAVLHSIYLPSVQVVEKCSIMCNPWLYRIDLSALESAELINTQSNERLTDLQCGGRCNDLQSQFSDAAYNVLFGAATTFLDAIGGRQDCWSPWTGGDCVDNFDFQDVHGHDCADWVDHNCASYGQAGWSWYSYTEAELLHVQENCPVTCELCAHHEACQDNADFEDTHGFDCESWEGEDCENYDGWWYDYSNEELADVRENCQRACGQCG